MNRIKHLLSIIKIKIYNIYLLIFNKKKRIENNEDNNSKIKKRTTLISNENESEKNKMTEINLNNKVVNKPIIGYFLNKKDTLEPVLWGHIKKTVKKKDKIVFENDILTLLLKLKVSFLKNKDFENHYIITLKREGSEKYEPVEKDVINKLIVFIENELEGKNLPPISFDYNAFLMDISALMGNFKTAKLLINSNNYLYIFDIHKKNNKAKIINVYKPKKKLAKLCYESIEKMNFCYLKIFTKQKIKNNEIYEIYSLFLSGTEYKKYFKIIWMFATAESLFKLMTLNLSPQENIIYCGPDGTKICGFDYV